MGAFATHIIFGDEVLEEMSDEMLKSIVNKYKGIYGIGCQGPDLFLYNIAMLMSGHDKNLGSRMHVEKSGRFFAYLLNAIWKQKDVQTIEVGLSYFMGLLAHYTMDTKLHPYVYARVGYDPKDPYGDKATIGIHFRLEAAIDAKLIASKLGYMPSAYYPAKAIKADRQDVKRLAVILAEAVSRCYHLNMKAENVTASVKMMQLIVRGFFDRSGNRKKYLSKIEFPFKEDGLCSNLFVEDEYVHKRGIMNTENAIWYHPWDHAKSYQKSVWEIFDDAVLEYQEYTKKVERLLRSYTLKIVRMRHDTLDFCDGMTNRELHRMICKASADLNNLSYHSGLPL